MMLPHRHRAPILAAGLLTACGAAPTAWSPRLDAPRPVLEQPARFVPPAPQVLELPRLPPIWLAERHEVPLVTVHVVVPYGSAADPPGRGGLAALTAEMMEQGAGRRGALELGRAAERLGASIYVTAGRDASVASLTVLASNLAPALELLGDVVARPRFEPIEWQRTRPLWLAGLRNDAFDPELVADAVADALLFGPEHPYGHPVNGTVDSVSALELEAVRAFHGRHWRRDRATIVAAGDVTAEQLGALLPRALLQWGSAGDPPAPPLAPPAPEPGQRVALVERPDSPQTVLLLVEPGPAAGDPARVPASLADVVLGGGFTSRLNLNLREDKGYTYGAGSSLPFARGVGASRAAAAVKADQTGPALVELRRELARMAASGLDAAELSKARASLRGEAVSAHQTADAVAGRLAVLAGLGLPPDHDARVARRREALDLEAVNGALDGLPSVDASVIAVGPPAALRAVLETLRADGRPPIVLRYRPDGTPADGAQAR